MWPAPAEVAAGLALILRRDVAPALTDDHARAQLFHVAAVLGQVDWDGGADRLRAADDDLRTLLAACAAWAADDGPRRDAFSALHPEAPTGGDDRTYAQVSAVHRARRRLLERFVVELADWRRRHAGEASADALWDRIGSHLAHAPLPAAAPHSRPPC